MKPKIFSAVRFVLLVSLPAFLSAPAGAGRICGTETATLVRIHASRDVISRSIRLPPPPVHIDEEYVVTRGGAGVVIRTERLLCCGFGVTRTFAEGLAKPAALAALNQALTANHVEAQASCAIENDLSTPSGARIIGTYELSWYDAGAAENSFRIEFADPGGSSLPPCGVEVQPLIDAVRTFADAIAAVRTNRICTP
jgi:hypothetical protein